MCYLEQSYLHSLHTHLTFFRLFATQTLGQFPRTPITGRRSDYASNLFKHISSPIFRARLYLTDTLPPLTGTPNPPVVERYPALTLRAFVTKRTLIRRISTILRSLFISAYRHPARPQKRPSLLLSAFAPSRLPFPVTLWRTGPSGLSIVLTCAGTHPSRDTQDVVI